MTQLQNSIGCLIIPMWNYREVITEDCLLCHALMRMAESHIFQLERFLETPILWNMAERKSAGLKDMNLGYGFCLCHLMLGSYSQDAGLLWASLPSSTRGGGFDELCKAGSCDWKESPFMGKTCIQEHKFSWHFKPHF